MMNMTADERNIWVSYHLIHTMELGCLESVYSFKEYKAKLEEIRTKKEVCLAKQKVNKWKIPKIVGKMTDS
mgnify:CR=1 FL=1